MLSGTCKFDLYMVTGEPNASRKNFLPACFLFCSLNLCWIYTFFYSQHSYWYTVYIITLYFLLPVYIIFVFVFTSIPPEVNPLCDGSTYGCRCRDKINKQMHENHVDQLSLSQAR